MNSNIGPDFVSCSEILDDCTNREEFKAITAYRGSVSKFGLAAHLLKTVETAKFALAVEREAVRQVFNTTVLMLDALEDGERPDPDDIRKLKEEIFKISAWMSK